MMNNKEERSAYEEMVRSMIRRMNSTGSWNEGSHNVGSWNEGSYNVSPYLINNKN